MASKHKKGSKVTAAVMGAVVGAGIAAAAGILSDQKRRQNLEKKVKRMISEGGKTVETAKGKIAQLSKKSKKLW